jgi:hypothetical protein
MATKVQCATHGESEKTFVCTHLLGGVAGLGFNRDEPSIENPFPDAWCDNCELIRAAHGGWNQQSQRLANISLLCAGCYERTRIRNTRTSIRLEDLDDLRWKCGACEEWHTGPCLDFGYESPYYWRREYDETSRRVALLPSWSESYAKTFLDNDYCAINNEDFFVRGLIELPIIGTAQTFRWGVWGSLSYENYETVLKNREEAKRSELPAMFSWLSTQIPEYPDTLNLKMQTHIQELGERPHFELELCDHLLSQEYHNGISPGRVKEIMIRRLHEIA